MDKVLKQRLIGASILIALAVIFIPMLFDAPDSDLSDRQLQIELPDPPGDRAQVRRLPLNPEAARSRAAPETRAEPAEPGVEPAAPERLQPAPAAPRAEPEFPPAAEPEPEAVLAPRPHEPDPVPDPEPVVEPEPEAQPESLDPLDAGGWIVQVASFGVESNALDLADQLARLGHTTEVGRLVRGESTLHRVTTGPYRVRAEADRALDQIKRTVAGVAPVVRGRDVEGDAPMPGIATAEDAYAVQVGSFASRNNATRLRSQLDGLGFDVFIHEDQAGSRTIWRVRVGPFTTRAQAEQSQAALIERAELEGLVVSHP